MLLHYTQVYIIFHYFTDPPPKDGYAVIVWLHSGDFSRGNASELNPFQMVFKQKVIIVTFTYRLGILGFFTTNDGEAPGNFGLMDQSAALRWVKRNIKQFNGNPDSITLMGHGAGAVAATLHIYSGVWAEENFHRVIIMSGTFLSPMMVRDPASYKSALSELAMNYGCFRRPTSALLACLRRVEASLLIMNSPMIDWMPVVDEGLSNETAMFIPDEPIGLLTNPPSYVRKIPIIIGYTDMEDVLDVTTGEMLTEGFSNEMYETLTKDIVLNELEILQSDNDSTCIDGSTFNNQPVLEAFNFVYKPFPPVNDENTLRRKYVQFSTERSFASPAFALAAAHSRNAEVFMYRFDIKPKTQSVSDILPVWGGVPHGFDLIYTWGMPYWLSLENDTQWVSEDKRISDIIMTMWANFAKFSNPTEWGVYINWTNFTANNQRALIIDRAFNMSDDTSINYHGIQFWNDYYPKVINFAMQCCNVTNAATSTRNVWNLNICSNSMHVIFLSFLTILLTFNGLRLYS